MLVSLGLLACEPRTARAVPYEIFVNVDTEEDLYELLVTGQVSDSTFDALLALHQTRVDLNQADRERLYLLPNLDYADVDGIIDYRRKEGPIRRLDELVHAGVVPVELADSLRAFVLIHTEDDTKHRTDAVMRIQGRWSGRYDRLPPPLALQARIRPLENLDIGGAATLMRNQLHRVRWDASRKGLSAGSERPRFLVPKLYIAWQERTWEIIVGTYRIGFAERLTFDVTDQIRPNGFFGDYELRRESTLTLRCKRAAGELAESPCPDAQVAYVTPDYTWTNRMTGLAVGLKHLDAGRGWVQIYAWGSYQIHRASQIEVVVTAECDDPRMDEDPACRAPPVFVRAGDPAAPTSEARFANLPRAYVEALAGGHASYSWSTRNHVGLTGFGAVPRWLVQGAELGFQEFAAKPFGGPFGAVGVDVAFGFGAQDFSFELARSFDRQRGGGGGFGAVARSITTLPTTELDISARYYDRRYANPYAHSIAAPDELDGLRVRDEGGFRVRTTTRIGRRTSLRAVADGWRRLSSGALHAALFARADLQLSPSWRLALWTQYRHGRNQRVSVVTALRCEPHPRLAVSAQFRHGLISRAPIPAGRQHDIGALGTIVARPIDILRLRLRVRYDLQGVSDDGHSPRVLWGYLDVSVAPRQSDTVRLRYDVRAFLDTRASTISRLPNPEHWLLFEYVWRY